MVDARTVKGISMNKVGPTKYDHTCMYVGIKECSEERGKILEGR